MKKVFSSDGDYEWFAVDRHGSLAMLTNCGSSTYPARLDVLQLPLLPTYRRFRALPEIGRCGLPVEHRPGFSCESWTEMSERGFYCYDYDLDGGSGYLLVSVPSVPLRWETLSASLRDQSLVFWFPQEFSPQYHLIPCGVICDLQELAGEAGRRP